MVSNGISILAPGQSPVIGLAKTLSANRAHFRTVLAEELGHHFTTVGDQFPKTFFHYADRLMISKEEYKALKWAAEFLIPMDKLFEVVGDGPTEFWEMAERLEVDQSLVEFRLKLVAFVMYCGPE